MDNGLLRGARYLLTGADLLTHRRLRHFVVLPLLANVLIFGFLLSFAYRWLTGTVELWIGILPEWLNFLRYLLVPLLVIAGALLAGWLFTSVANLVAAPFNSLLSEQTIALLERTDGGLMNGLTTALTAIPRSMGRELRKLWYFIPRVLLVLLAMLLPPLAPVAPLMWFLLSAWIMAVQYIDYPADNARVPFREMLGQLRYHGSLSIGFGGAVALAASIPLLNLIVMPAAVVGATVLWHEQNRRAQANSSAGGVSQLRR
jgi:CysZ protein